MKIVKAFLSMVKLQKAFQAWLNGKDRRFTFVDLNGIRVRVFIAPELAHFGPAFAANVQQMGSIVVVTEDSLVFDKEVFDRVGSFLVAHEYAHIQLGHVKSNKSVLAQAEAIYSYIKREMAAYNGHVDSKELAADRYAFNLVGKTATATSMFRLSEITRGTTRSEIQKRRVVLGV